MATKYKQRPDGRYAAKVWDGSYKDGKKHYIFLYSTKSSRDLERIVQDFELKRQNGLITIENNVSIQQYAKDWLSAFKHNKEAGTKAMYNNIIEVHMKDLDVPFDYFTLKNIQSVINKCSDKPRTCQQLKLTLKQVGISAEHDKLLERGKTEEIFSRIELPKYKSKEKRVLTEAEKNTLRTHNWTDKQRLYLFTLYYTGMRKEEALALKYEDIEGDYITINKAVGFDGTRPYIKTPKTERGNRTIPIPEQLRQIYSDLHHNGDREALLFPMANSPTLMTKDAYRAFWRVIQNVFGTDLTAHIFRHNYCSQLCYIAAHEGTISTKKIAELLGDTEKMVLEVYSHIIEDKENTTGALNKALNF